MSDNRMLEVIDEEGNVIGRETREHIHREGLLHREVHVWLYTPDGNVILQRRAKDKDLYPGLLDASVGGHVEMGADYEESAITEMRGTRKGSSTFFLNFEKREKRGLYEPRFFDEIVTEAEKYAIACEGNGAYFALRLDRFLSEAEHQRQNDAGTDEGTACINNPESVPSLPCGRNETGSDNPAHSPHDERIGIRLGKPQGPDHGDVSYDENGLQNQKRGEGRIPLLLIPRNVFPQYPEQQRHSRCRQTRRFERVERNAAILHTDNAEKRSPGDQDVDCISSVSGKALFGVGECVGAVTE
jgi:hypothetical protein